MFVYGAALLAWMALRRERSSVVSAYWGLPLSTVLILSIININHAINFEEFLHHLKSAADSRTGLVAIEDLRLPESLSAYGWGFTYPTISVLIRRNAGSAVILNPADYRGWEPFDPRMNIPSLARYYP
jgi:hypothetical protein